MYWKEITAERYTEALETARPMLWLPYGFLRGHKPIVYRDCRIVKLIQPVGTPFVTSKGQHWEGSELMTVAEFSMLDLDAVGPSN